jgi:hypothetical protein
MKTFTLLILFAVTFLACSSKPAEEKTAAPTNETETQKSSETKESSAIKDRTDAPKEKKDSLQSATASTTTKDNTSTKALSMDSKSSTAEKEEAPKTLQNDDEVETVTKAVEETSFHDHASLNKVLRTYVNSKGNVNYAGLKKQLAPLRQYIATLENTPPQSGWSREEKLSYWINLYNAVTLELVTKNYPVKSIRDIADNPWKLKLTTIDGKKLSLDHIENEIIRPQFNESRIHFAVNCAAASCPPLLNEAFTAQQLESQLQKLTIAFVNNPTYNTLSSSAISISKIFEWYAADFGALVPYLNRYAKIKIKSDASISYREYDWSLNTQ